MGNGQCPICYGAGPSFYPHLLYPTPEGIGHKPGCTAPVQTIKIGEYEPGPLSGIQEHRLAHVKHLLQQFNDKHDELMFLTLSGINYQNK
jgi:hypothetical protein